MLKLIRFIFLHDRYLCAVRSLIYWLCGYLQYKTFALYQPVFTILLGLLHCTNAQGYKGARQRQSTE